jgi:radical SAM superfamily enzyme YgiQ (UPF0313 family)
MKLLFIVSELILSEPIGVMQLSAICKKHNHSTKLISLKQHNLYAALKEYSPDVIAYSVMTPDANLFVETDKLVKDWMKSHNKSLVRLMGGPHPTYFPEILDKCGLDAVCMGEGDNAIAEVLTRLKTGSDLTGIPNILSRGMDKNETEKELIVDLDSLPFPDRDILYESVPQYRRMRLRSFLTSRGCPYNCTYCYNNTFNNMFKECGKIMRRRSVDNVIEEMRYVVKNYQPVKFIRFADDTFAHTVDGWLVEFLEKYRKEIGLPFYCLMRSNTLTEDMARLLSEAGCKSISMSIEAGNEHIRNTVLKRRLSNDMVVKSFENAKKFNIKTQSNTILGIPGTTLQHDFESFEFAKKLEPTVPTFSIFCPYPGTELTNYAIEKGLFDGSFDDNLKFYSKSALNCYTEKEKDMQKRLCLLAPIFCSLPDYFKPLLKLLVKLKLDRLYSLVGAVQYISALALKIFPQVYPLNPLTVLKVFGDSLRYRKTSTKENKFLNES